MRAAFKALTGTARLCLARAFGSEARYWEQRLPFDATEVDMVDNPGEQFYATLYLDFILPALPLGQPLRILDAGCQTGRLSIPLARAGHDVLGVDVSARCIDRCRTHCQESGVTVELLCQDIEQAVHRFPRQSFDVILCTEVLYTLKHFRIILEGFRSILRDGGKLFASHRTRYSVLSTMLKYRKVVEANRVLTYSEGEILGEYFNWFDEDDLRNIYTAIGYRVLLTTGIGVLSGIGVDGLSHIVNPSRLTSEEREALLSFERLCGRAYRQVARYLLLAAEVTRGGS